MAARHRLLAAASSEQPHKPQAVGIHRATHSLASVGSPRADRPDDMIVDMGITGALPQRHVLRLILLRSRAKLALTEDRPSLRTTRSALTLIASAKGKALVRSGET